jgi:hypothetical protein
MVLGAVSCPADKARMYSRDIRDLKQESRLSRSLEVKWTKVSPGKLEFYLTLIAYFFGNPDLHFRALVIPDKMKLRHDLFGQDHDTWYYKMFFETLKIILEPPDRYRIYLDIKDTRSALKMAKLHEVLSNNLRDFQHQTVERVQTIRSHESGLLQLADLLIGAVGYANKSLYQSPAKKAVTNYIAARAGRSLRVTSPRWERKTNVLVWQATEVSE